jgi:hypothetical protein
MKRFEYEITRHNADEFMRMVYFCSEGGQCKLEEVPADEPQYLVDMLNQRGREGWELIQLLFGKDGVMACWKRQLASAGDE